MLNFNIFIAEEFGLEEAIVFEYIRTSCQNGSGEKINGVLWVKLDARKLQRDLPFLLYPTIRETLKRLRRNNLIVSYKFDCEDDNRALDGHYSLTIKGERIARDYA